VIGHSVPNQRKLKSEKQSKIFLYPSACGTIISYMFIVFFADDKSAMRLSMISTV
jgi:hypothetical protein